MPPFTTVIPSSETDPLFFTVRGMIWLDVFSATLEKVTGEGETVSGPMPLPVTVAESVWRAAPVTVTVPFSTVRAFGANCTIS